MTTYRSEQRPTIAAPRDGADWFEHWFGEDYLFLYPHRDEAEAADAIELIARHVAAAGIEVATVLDLACGAGRHARLLEERWWTVGLDLSAALLKVARKEAPDTSFVRADMRELPFANASFDLVVNLFTSFGYFEDDYEHARVIRCVGAATRPGGAFVLDYLNPEQVERTLVAYDEQDVNGIAVEQHRAITPDRRFVEKRIRIRDGGKEYIERVRLFSPSDLEAMLTAGGFEVVRVAGDYGGGQWAADSPRTIVFGTRR